MRYFASIVFCLFLFSVTAQAQDDDLFGKTGDEKKSTTHKGFVIGANASFDFPMADMAKRFGTDFRIGGALSYKTKSNWMIGAKADFLFGDKVKEDSLMANIKTSNGGFIDQTGQVLNVGTYERGYMIGVQLGKIINITKEKTDNGILVMTGAGFIQHKIRIYDQDKTIPELRGDYLKGYDRLTNGWYLEQYVGYSYFASNSLINFHVGLDFMAAFTQGRRDYLFDVMKPGNDKRLDMLFGIRAGWYFPIFRRKSDDYYF
ncbi:hypothetical protein ACTHGU_04045 [Chitinophagaceae bacterium MMS25-I14]